MFNEKLIAECICILHIDDNETDYIGLLVLESIDYFRDNISEQINFENGSERSLLKNRVRYAYNNNLEDFSTNFRAEIGGLQVKYAKKIE